MSKKFSRLNLATIIGFSTGLFFGVMGFWMGKDLVSIMKISLGTAFLGFVLTFISGGGNPGV